MSSSISCLKHPARTRFQVVFYNPRLVVGRPHDAEFGVNFPTYHTGGGNSFSLLGHRYGDLRVRGAEY